MRSDDEQRLSAFYDGELPPAEMERVRAELEADDSLRAKLEGLAHLSAMVRLGTDSKGADAEVDGGALFERISSSLIEETDLALSCLYDGELPADEAAALRARMADDAVLRQKHDGLRHLSGLIAVAVGQLDERIDGAALFARIQGGVADAQRDEDAMFPAAIVDEAAGPRLDEEPVEVRPVLRVVAGGREEPVEAAPPARRGGAYLGAFGLVLAAAAVLGLLYLRPVEPTVTPPDETPPPVASVEPAPGSAVEEVDFGYSTGAIFALEGQDGEPIAVVWISDEKLDGSDLHPDSELPGGDDARERLQ